LPSFHGFKCTVPPDHVQVPEGIPSGWSPNRPLCRK
jgi:hypothetical protein